MRVKKQLEAVRADPEMSVTGVAREIRERDVTRWEVALLDYEEVVAQRLKFLESHYCRNQGSKCVKLLNSRKRVRISSGVSRRRRSQLNSSTLNEAITEP